MMGPVYSMSAFSYISQSTTSEGRMTDGIHILRGGEVGTVGDKGLSAPLTMSFVTVILDMVNSALAKN